MPVICTYLLIINVLGLVLMHADKKRAQMKRMRLPERLLLGVAFIGGSIGVSLGMFLFHHKTRKPLFSVLVPILIPLQFLICVLARFT